LLIGALPQALARGLKLFKNLDVFVEKHQKFGILGFHFHAKSREDPSRDAERSFDSCGCARDEEVHPRN
jgi:hypothetical protein